MGVENAKVIRILLHLKASWEEINECLQGLCNFIEFLDVLIVKNN